MVSCSVAPSGASPRKPENPKTRYNPFPAPLCATSASIKTDEIAKIKKSP
jgi:hypothetical protein